MKHTLALALLALATAAQAQTVLPATCPSGVLCAQATWTANGFSATATGTGYLWKCNGGAANCSAANLVSNAAGYWVLVGTVPLNSTAGSAADTSIAYSQSLYYAIADQLAGGTMSAFTAPFPLQVGQAPPPVTPAPTGVNVVQKP